MKTEEISLPSINPGAAHALTVQRFGEPGARPRIYVQASLHADELPGMICAVELRRSLLDAEAKGEIAGEIVLVPVANPLGLGQTLFGHAIGRFSLADGGNFNRDFPHLTEGAAARLGGRLGPDAQANAAAIRLALAEELEAWNAPTQAAALKKELVRLALGSDVVLDLHCDAEAAVHLYTQGASSDFFAPLGAHLGSRATLTAEVSGGDPFDEVFSRPWLELARRFPDSPIPMGCHAATVELRGQADVGETTARADADAVMAFLRHLGAVAGAPPAAPGPPPPVTPLEASEPLIAPRAGIVLHRFEPGASVHAGHVVIDIVDALTGEAEPIRARSSGVLFARSAQRFAQPGARLGKIAGSSLKRSGKLLGL
jgi:predicted deacylase